MTSASASAPPQVAAIIPAYNEQETLGDVLAVLRATSRVDEVLLVSDGSTDETLAIARAYGVKAIHLKRNCGKGLALATGVHHTTAPILVFVDGDILNLADYLLGQLIDPVLAGEAAMNIGVRNRGWLLNAIHRQTGPLLSGIRCLRREIFTALPAEYLVGYRVETALNWACRRLGYTTSTTVLYGLRHLVKERKRGLSVGLGSRLEMFGSVLLAYLRLRLSSPPLARIEATPAGAGPELEYINF